MQRYKRGLGHVLGVDHDVITCTACAYDAGFRDGRASVLSELEDLPDATAPGE